MTADTPAASRRPGRTLVAGVRTAMALLALPLAVQAQGVAYVSSEKDNTLSVLDLKTQTIVGTVPTCKRPRNTKTRYSITVNER